MKKVAIGELKPNPNNPRIIKDDKFKKLVQSIKDLPEMAEVRPVVVNTDMVVLGGNMRLKAMREAGWKEVPIEVVDWDEDKQRQFIIKDNVSGGEWDWEMLANQWNAEELQDWGLDVWKAPAEVDYSNKNEEINIDDLDATMTLKLNFNEDEYWQVKKQLAQIASTPEQALMKLLGNE
jgi:hypothetical protein